MITSEVARVGTHLQEICYGDYKQFRYWVGCMY